MKNVLVDLDGVLVDMVNGACKVHGKDNPYKQNEKGAWDFWELIGVAEDEFWKPLGFDFWANLDWMPNGKDILASIEKLVPQENICILSSPCRTPGCVDGKLEWVKRNLPQYERQVLIGKPKHFCASNGSILIDDYEENVKKFARSGGNCILVPRPWNSVFALEAKGAKIVEFALRKYLKKDVLTYDFI